jgi:hypothetical protein
MDLEGRDRGLILMYYPSILLQGLKNTKISFRIVGFRAKIETGPYVIDTLHKQLNNNLGNLTSYVTHEVGALK